MFAPTTPMKLRGCGFADLQDLVNSAAEVSCANRAYNCHFDGAAIWLSAFNMAMLIVFLLAWAICIALARECTPNLGLNP